MDKKNTMLLTVIAVATLLVAVVGATFAYFSVTGNGSSTTTVTASTDSVGSVSLAGNSTGLKLTLTAADMSKAAAGDHGKVFYSTDSDEPLSVAIPSAGGTATVPGNAAQLLSVATLDGGKAGVKYVCTAKYTVTLDVPYATGDEDYYFQQGDGSIVLVPDTGLKLTTEKNNSTEANTIELSTITLTADKTDSPTKKTGSFERFATFEFTRAAGQDSAPAAAQPINLKGYLTITNKPSSITEQEDTGKQNYFAGKTFTLTVAASDFICDTVAKLPSESAD